MEGSLKAANYKIDQLFSIQAEIISFNFRHCPTLKPITTIKNIFVYLESWVKNGSGPVASRNCHQDNHQKNYTEMSRKRFNTFRNIGWFHGQISRIGPISKLFRGPNSHSRRC